MRDLTDLDFDLSIQKILSKDKSGLKEIYDHYGGYIYQQMISVVKSPQDAEDLTSEFFLRLWETAAQYRSGNGHKRYLTVMARNLAIDFLRKMKHESYSLDDDEVYREEQADTSLSPDDEIVGNINFAEALSILKPDEKEIVNMHLGFEMTFSEISEVLNRPLGTVAWKYRQALIKLKKSVKEGSIYG